MSARNIIIFRIQNQYLWSVIYNFPNNAFETNGFWCIVSLTAILRLLHVFNFISNSVAKDRG